MKRRIGYVATCWVVSAGLCLAAGCGGEGNGGGAGGGGSPASGSGGAVSSSGGPASGSGSGGGAGAGGGGAGGEGGAGGGGTGCSAASGGLAGGTPIWSKAARAVNKPQIGTALTTLSDGSRRFAAGYFEGGLLGQVSAGGDDIFLAQLNTPTFAGWSKRFGDAGDQRATAIAIGAASNLFVTGRFEGQVDFGAGTLTSAGGYDAFIASFTDSGVLRWGRRFGDASDQRAASILVDGANRVVVTGRFEGTVDFGGGPLTSAGGADIFVAKLDANGNHLFSKRFGGAGDQEGVSVARDGSDNLIVVGAFEGAVDFGGGALTSAGGKDIVVAKLDASGNHVWSRRFGGAGDEIPTNVDVVSSGGFALTGAFDGATDLGGGALTSAGGRDLFVARFDAAGNHVWSERFGGAGDQIGEAVRMDGLSVFVTGSFENDVDFGGGPLTSHGGADMFLAKLDIAGHHVYSRRAGGAGDDAGKAMLRMADGQVHIIGYADGSFDGTSPPGTDVLLADFDVTTGDAAYEVLGDDTNQHIGRSIAVDSRCNVLVTGSFVGDVDFGGGVLPGQVGSDPDAIFLAKFDALGHHIWSKTFGKGRGNRVAVDAADNVVVVGDVSGFGGVPDFGGGPLTEPGSLFVAKLDPDGHHLWSKRAGFPGAEPNDVAVDGSNNVLLTGYFSGTLDLGGLPVTTSPDPLGYTIDLFATKLDPDGTPLFSEHYRVEANPSNRIAVDGAGNALVSSYVAYTPQPLILGGATIPADRSFVVKLSPTGEVLWTSAVREPCGDNDYQVAFDTAGDAVIAGRFCDSVDLGTGPIFNDQHHDAFVAKLGVQGDLLWLQGVGEGDGTFNPTGMVLDGAGDIAVVGSLTGTVQVGDRTHAEINGGRDDILVAKLDASGGYLWSKSYGDEGIQKVRSVAADRDGYLHLAGEFQKQLDFGDGPLVGSHRTMSQYTGYDLFVAKLAP